MKPYKLFMNINVLFGFSASTLHFYQSGIKAEYIKQIFVLKIKDEEVFLPPKLKSLFNTVLSEIKLNSEAVINPFMSKGLDLVHSGFPQLNFESFVGIPQYFAISDNSKVNIVTMVDDIECTPGSPEAKALQTSFQLSEKAKKFALAREIYDLNHSSFYLFGFLPLTAVSFGNAILMKAKSQPVKLFNPIIFCCLVSTFSYFVYSILHDAVYVYKKADANYKVAQLGKEYIEGGIEYFEKILQRNKTLKCLSSNYNFTESGDIPVNLNRTNTVKFRTQINSLKELLKDNKSSSKFKMFVKYYSDNFKLEN